MSTDGVKVPAKRSLLTVAGAALMLAGVIAGYGFVSRVQSKQEVVDWTIRQTTPTVSLASFIPTPPNQTLTLPGNVQPFNKAAIYARVNG